MCGPWSLRQRREGRLCNVESGQLIPVANTAPKGIAVPAVLVDSDPACWFVGGVAQRLAADALAGCVVLVDEDRRNARPELMKDALLGNRDVPRHRMAELAVAKEHHGRTGGVLFHAAGADAVQKLLTLLGREEGAVQRVGARLVAVRSDVGKSVGHPREVALQATLREPGTEATTAVAQLGDTFRQSFGAHLDVLGERRDVGGAPKHAGELVEGIPVVAVVRTTALLPHSAVGSTALSHPCGLVDVAESSDLWRVHEVDARPYCRPLDRLA